MPSGRLPEGPTALSNAERQARHRAKMLALGPPLPAKPPKVTARRSRSKRWNDALAVLFAVQAECAAWAGATPVARRVTLTDDAESDLLAIRGCQL